MDEILVILAVIINDITFAWLGYCLCKRHKTKCGGTLVIDCSESTPAMYFQCPKPPDEMANGEELSVFVTKLK